MRFLLSLAFLTFALFGAAFLLSGCESAKYVECIARDNTRNPCN